jgi:16S rRNA (adenine1518-N6/adenine1519-N6)-dimethyltransferase
MRKQQGARLGQHFLTHAHYARRLAESVTVHTGETILEIGPGKGILTRELLATGAHVLAIEKDPSLVAFLAEAFGKEVSAESLTIVEGDVRDFDPASQQLLTSGYVLAANIPYYITGEILRQFLTSSHPPRAMALLMQKEVAERIVARDKKESILSLSVKAYGTPNIITKVPRGAFSPPPSVDSAILVVDQISKDFFSDISEKRFFEIVRAGFSSKRKLLLGNLSVFAERPVLERIFLQCGLDSHVRAEDVQPSVWHALARALFNEKSPSS